MGPHNLMRAQDGSLVIIDWASSTSRGVVGGDLSALLNAFQASPKEIREETARYATVAGLNIKDIIFGAAAYAARRSQELRDSPFRNIPIEAFTRFSNALDR
jgi:hypothetical protein